MGSFIPALSSSIIIAGCCSAKTEIFPKEKHLLAITHADSESCAFEDCKKSAEGYCAARGKRFILIKEASKYQGMDKNAKGIMQGMGYAAGVFIPTDSQDDYKIAMAFRCR